MKYIGNERSWEVFEEGFDEDSAGEVQRPNEDSSQSIKEKWIAAKYVNRQFVKLSRQPDLSSVEVEDEDERIEIIRQVKMEILNKIFDNQSYFLDDVEFN